MCDLSVFGSSFFPLQLWRIIFFNIIMGGCVRERKAKVGNAGAGLGDDTTAGNAMELQCNGCIL